MKIRTQKRILYLLGAFFLASAVGVVLAAFFYPPSKLIAKPPTSSVVSPEMPSLRNVDDFKKMVTKRLQGPLVDPLPEPKVQPTSKSAARPVELPKTIVLHSIFYSKEAAIAVLTANNKTYRCRQGESIESVKVTVKEILADEVVFEFGGKEFRRAIKN